jgi:Hypothetical protein TTHB210
MRYEPGRGRGRHPAAVVAAAAAALGMMLASCKGEPTGASQPATDYGAPVAVGNGTARSYLIVQNGAPTELGVALSPGALDSLPTAAKMGGYEYLVPLPADNTTQYQVIGLNWNPTGHPPAGIYTVPHFDFHFYMISLAAKDSINPADPAFATEAATVPAAPYQPANYVSDPPANAVPYMGLHWHDSTAVEYHGQPFTRTFIEGSWNGQFIFAEPMVTAAYLLTKPDTVIAVPSATQRAIAGYYPAAYRVSWNQTGNEWRVGLVQLSR